MADVEWACAEVIDRQLGDFGQRDTVEQIQGDRRESPAGRQGGADDRGALPATLRVAARSFAPFVFYENRSCGGFSVELVVTVTTVGYGNGAVRVVGPVFERVRYGAAVAAGSPLREEINIALLELVERGAYDRLHDRWSGATAAAGRG